MDAHALVATCQPVARRLGTTTGSFYWHFADRQDLLSALLALWEDQETTQAVAALATISDPMAQLVALGRRAYTRASRGARRPARGR